MLSEPEQPVERQSLRATAYILHLPEAFVLVLLNQSTMLFWRRCIPQTSVMIIILHHDNTPMARVCLCEHGATVPPWQAIR